MHGEDFLNDLAAALAPDSHCTQRMDRARNRLSEAVNGTFGPEAHFEFFGSAVNGFETASSEPGAAVNIKGKTKHLNIIVDHVSIIWFSIITKFQIIILDSDSYIVSWYSIVQTIASQLSLMKSSFSWTAVRQRSKDVDVVVVLPEHHELRNSDFACSTTLLHVCLENMIWYVSNL